MYLYTHTYAHHLDLPYKLLHKCEAVVLVYILCVCVT